MKTACLIGPALLLFMAGAVQGQGLLDRLEKRLEGILEETPRDERTSVVQETAYLGLVAEEDEDRRVRVVDVRRKSPAETAGLQRGDLITAIDDTPIKNMDDLEKHLTSKAVGAAIALHINRKGKSEQLDAVLTAPPDEAPLPAPLVPPRNVPSDPEPEPTRSSLGITVLPVTDEARRKHGLSVRQGAFISAVAPGGAAERAGLPVGGVVVASEGRRIQSPEELIEQVRAMKPGDKLLLSYYQGASLYRKTVTLQESSATARVVDAEMPSDRPILRRLEKALEGAAADLPARLPFTDNSGDLAGEVQRLKDRIAELERRLEEVEAQLEPKPRPERRTEKPPPPPKPEVN